MTSDQELEQVLDSLKYMLRQCANRERWPRSRQSREDRSKTRRWAASRTAVALMASQRANSSVTSNKPGLI
jgi:hypothetical protein